MVGEAPKSRSLQPLSISVEQAAEFTSLGVRTIWRKIASGEIRAKKVGGRTIILYRDLEEFLDSLPSA